MDAGDRSGPAGGSSKTIVDVRDVRKTYRSWSIRKRKTIEALRGVSLEASAGEVFGLLGPNGAGKTTLIKVLLGVVKPTGGEAYLFDSPIGSAEARSRVGYLPESLSIDPHHTARSALNFYGRLSNMTGQQIAKRSDELLELVGLADRDKESVRRFSKGMRQRLGLAQALMHNPDLLVLDEPTDGLDPVGRSQVRAVIERLRDEGKTIFLNSHILQEVELVCTRVAILAKGRLRGSGKPDELAVDRVSRKTVIDTTFLDGDVNEDHQKTVQTLLQENAGDLTVEVAATEQLDQQITLQATNQSDIDRVVDLLREAKISIRKIEIQRPSLEDTFMHLVGNDEDDLFSETEV